MHEVGETTEQMVRSVLTYVEDRLLMDPVPSAMGCCPPTSCMSTSTG